MIPYTENNNCQASGFTCYCSGALTLNTGSVWTYPGFHGGEERNHVASPWSCCIILGAHDKKL